MDKLIFYKPSRQKSKTGTALVRVSAEAYNAISAIEAETGKSMSFIASQMVLYAAKNAEIREGGCDDE